MDPKLIAFGASVVAAAVIGGATGGLIIGDKDEAKVTYVAMSTVEGDVAAQTIAENGPQENKDRVCVKQKMMLDGRATIGWLCNGTYLPEQQAFLTKQAGEDGVRIDFKAEKTVDGNMIYNGTVTKGSVE